MGALHGVADLHEPALRLLVLQDVPAADVVVRPYPAFQKRTGGGFYTAGPPGQPGTYLLGTYEPEKLSKAGLEATAFHETYPGHHMQASVVLERGGAHPVLKYFYNSGMGEGWALYTERLADEMGLYSGDIDRLGMLSNEALRAARLVVDPGMHVLGWSRERAIQYMLENTAESESEVAYEIDRYLAVPGQATAYLTGSLEIQRLRFEADNAHELACRADARHDAQGFAHARAVKQDVSHRSLHPLHQGPRGLARAQPPSADPHSKPQRLLAAHRAEASDRR